MKAILLSLLFALVHLQETAPKDTPLKLRMDTLTSWPFFSPDGKRIILERQGTGIRNVFSYDPVPDGKVITVSVKLISTTHFYDSIGFASALGRTPCWLGCTKESFSWHIDRNIGRCINAVDNKCIPYGRTVFVGDVITVRLDLTDSAGSVAYFLNGQSLGIAFTGVRRWAPLYFGIHLDTINDAVEILNATVSDF